MDTTSLVYFSTLLGCMISLITLAKFLFYTKSEMDAKCAEFKTESDQRDESLLANVNKVHTEIKDDLIEQKEYIHRHLLEAERNSSHITQEFTNLLNAVKDELRADSINRYNDLLKLVNSKVSLSDFDRLENKFDKVTETITELKTIVQFQMDGQKKNNN